MPACCAATAPDGPEWQGGNHHDRIHEATTGAAERPDRLGYLRVFGLAGWPDGCLAAWPAAQNCRPACRP